MESEGLKVNDVMCSTRWKIAIQNYFGDLGLWGEIPCGDRLEPTGTKRGCSRCTCGVSTVFPVPNIVVKRNADR